MGIRGAIAEVVGDAPADFIPGPSGPGQVPVLVREVAFGFLDLAAEVL